jgi:3-hydroxyisobutyrate dehydrogenase
MRTLFIGIGSMGKPIAKRIEKLSSVSFLDVYDNERTNLKEFSRSVSSLKDLDHQLIFSMLPDDQAIEDTFLKSDIFKSLPKRCFIVDLSTTSPKLSRHLSMIASKHDHLFIDSPVSGGVGAATNGTLSLLMGCTPAEVDPIMPILKGFSKTQIYLSERGNGSVAKVCNNFVMLSTMIATCEAIAAATKSGVSSEDFVNVLNNCSGQSWVSSLYSPVPVSSLSNLPCHNSFDNGYKVSLAVKDLKLAMNIFADSPIDSKILNSIFAAYNKIAKEGKSSKDIGIYIKEFL